MNKLNIRPKLTFRLFLLLALLIYIAAHAFLYFNQRSFIFFPQKPGQTTPADYGVKFNQLFINTSDGFKLSAWHIPLENPADDTPFLIYCHGNGANLNMLSEVSAIFHSYGWETILFDYRAYGLSTGSFKDLNEGALYQDASAVFKWVRENYPKRPIIVWGHSLGSAVAAALGEHHDFTGLILEDAFPSVKEMAIEKFPAFPLIRYLLKDEFNTSKYLSKRLFKPVLFIHAEKDSVIPLKYGKAAFEQAPDPANWLLIKGIDHNQFPEVHKEYKDKIIDIVKSWIY